MLTAAKDATPTINPAVASDHTIFPFTRSLHSSLNYSGRLSQTALLGVSLILLSTKLHAMAHCGSYATMVEQTARKDLTPLTLV